MRDKHVALWALYRSVMSQAQNLRTDAEVDRAGWVIEQITCDLVWQPAQTSQGLAAKLLWVIDQLQHGDLDGEMLAFVVAEAAAWLQTMPAVGRPANLLDIC